MANLRWGKAKSRSVARKKPGRGRESGDRAPRELRRSTEVSTKAEAPGPGTSSCPSSVCAALRAPAGSPCAGRTCAGIPRAVSRPFWGRPSMSELEARCRSAAFAACSWCCTPLKSRNCGDAWFAVGLRKFVRLVRLNTSPISSSRRALPEAEGVAAACRTGRSPGPYAPLRCALESPCRRRRRCRCRCRRAAAR